MLRRYGGSATTERPSIAMSPAVGVSKPAIKSQLVPFDYDWWVDNRDAVVGRWNKWILA